MIAHAERYMMDGGNPSKRADMVMNGTLVTKTLLTSYPIGE